MNSERSPRCRAYRFYPANQPCGTTCDQRRENERSTRTTGGSSRPRPSPQTRNYRRRQRPRPTAALISQLVSERRFICLGDTGGRAVPANRTASLIGAATVSRPRSPGCSRPAAGRYFFIVRACARSLFHRRRHAAERQARLDFTPGSLVRACERGHFIPFRPRNAVRWAIAASPATFGFNSSEPAPASPSMPRNRPETTPLGLLVLVRSGGAVAIWSRPTPPYSRLFADDASNMTTAGQKIQADTIHNSLIVRADQISFTAQSR